MRHEGQHVAFAGGQVSEAVVLSAAAEQLDGGYQCLIGVGRGHADVDDVDDDDVRAAPSACLAALVNAFEPGSRP